MIIALRCLFLLIVLAMIAGTVWACLEEDVFDGGSHILDAGVRRHAEQLQQRVDRHGDVAEDHDRDEPAEAREE